MDLLQKQAANRRLYLIERQSVPSPLTPLITGLLRF